MFKPTSKQPVSRERIICFDTDQKTIEILPIESENEEVIRTADKTFPRAECTLSLSKQGKVYLFQAPTYIVQGTQHLARVEASTVLRQITQYRNGADDEKRIDFFKIALVAGIIIMGIVAAMK